MTIEAFEQELQTIRAANGWYINIKCVGIWIVEVLEKGTHAFLAETGCTSLEGVLVALRLGLHHEVWLPEVKPLQPEQTIQAEIDRVTPLISTVDIYHGPYRDGLKFALDKLA